MSRREPIWRNLHNWRFGIVPQAKQTDVIIAILRLHRGAKLTVLRLWRQRFALEEIQIADTWIICANKPLAAWPEDIRGTEVRPNTLQAIWLPLILVIGLQRINIIRLIGRDNLTHGKKNLLTLRVHQGLRLNHVNRRLAA